VVSESQTLTRPSATLSRWERVVAIVLMAMLVGCNDSQQASPTAPGVASHDQIVEELFDSAIGLLNELDEFDSGDALTQVVNRLNQWVAVQKPLTGWRVDPLVDELPAELRNLQLMRSLAALKFQVEDGLGLQEAVWMRDVARGAVGHEQDDLARAQLMFDWIVRNVQLAPEVPSEEQPPAVRARLAQMPWETLLFGRGQAVDRAWAFMLMARQQELDVVMLAYRDSKQELHAWLPALLVGEQLYLFDAELGLPLPGPRGRGVATLADATEKPDVFAQWNLNAEHQYRLQPADLKRVVALVEASPVYLEERMKLVELRLAGPERLKLSTDPSDLVARLKKLPQVSDAGLWKLPYERMQTRSQLKHDGLEKLRHEVRLFRESTLWKARVLQLMGHETGERGAIHYYQLSRPADAEVAEAKLDEPRKALISLVKEDASYWLGIIAFERGNYDTAADYFARRTLAAHPKGPWTWGAQYNLARTYEAQQRTDEAIEIYQASQSPQRYGNLLRARELQKQSKQK
jgi:tetratricopeptide (TPR) repeat protein